MNFLNFFSGKIKSVIAILIIIFTFVLFFLLLFVPVKGIEKDILVFILGAVTNNLALILSFYFGSSIGSEKKAKTIDTIINQTSEQKENS